MTLHHAALCAILTAALALPAAAAPDGQSGREIMDKVYSRPEGADRSGIITMTLTNHRGAAKAYTFKYAIKEYGKDKKSLITFLEPENVLGMGFLQYDYWDPAVEDERWLFLPALAQEKRIAGESMSRSFLGSDFTYEEMGWRSTDEDTHTLLGEEEVGGVPCWIVESVPVAAESPYAKVVSWVNKENFVQVQNHFYDRGGALLKVLTTSDVRLTDGYWTVYSTRMENVQKAHVTEYKLREVQHDAGLSDDLFDARNLKGAAFRISAPQK